VCVCVCVYACTFICRRRAGGPGSNQGEDRAKHQRAEEDGIASQNEELTNVLDQNVSLLKNLTINIGKELDEQNTDLDEQDDAFSSVTNMLSGTMNAMDRMVQTGGTKQICQLTAFIFIVFWVIYYLVF
jgi:blocked early in transport 1